MSENETAETRPLLSRRRVLAGASLTAGAVLGGLTTSVAWAASTEEESVAPSEAAIEILPDAVHAPDRLAPGQVTFRVTTPGDKAGLSLLLIKLKVPLKRYLTDLKAMGTAEGPEETAKAAAKVEANAENLGGAVLLPDRTVTFTQVLTPGEYHLIGYAYGTPGAEPVPHALSVRGKGKAPDPRVDGLILHTPTGFIVPGEELRADGSHLVVNRSGLLNEAVLIPVKPGTTEQDIEDFFEALGSGDQPPPAPFVGESSGLAPLSPGRIARLRTGLDPGEYLLSSWVTSTETGRPRAFAGFHKLVRLT